EFHGGTIWLDTENTEGTRICFTLSIVEPTADPDDAADFAAAATSPTARERVPEGENA
ncbi:MAG: hypothetical protein HOQ44_11405, partial [Nocardia sp.]|nr:hypothetical protein [Nocardia sp.]